MRRVPCRGPRRPWLAFLALATFPTAAHAQVQERVTQGKELFQAKCAACHSEGTDRIVGPGLGGVATERSREWLIPFITHPDRVIASGDSIATRLVAEYGIPMPNLGITPEEAGLILDYLSGSMSGEPAAAESGAGVNPVNTAGSPDLGRQLFTGRHRLANGGTACVSCHSVSDLGGLGGGTLARDLTGAATLYGAGLPQVLESPPFPLMRAVYRARPLTEEEISHLSAFLRESTTENAQSGLRPLPFPAAGLGGAFLLMVLFGVIWRDRLRDVRKPLIGGRP